MMGDADFLEGDFLEGEFLDTECRRLLTFGLRSGLPGGGTGYLDDDGEVMPGRGTDTMLTARMAHVYSLGAMLGFPGSEAVADTALRGLTDRLKDTRHGGWFHALNPDGTPDVAGGKVCYEHAFVMLAAASATIAGRPGAPDLLDQAAETYLQWFWDAGARRPIDHWDAGFTAPGDYRGLNSTMHSVEAMLAVADALPAHRADEAAAWRSRAIECAVFTADLTARYDARLPEHFDSDWTPTPELNRDRPSDPFKPFGATPGHGMEWARLLLQTETALGYAEVEGHPDPRTDDRPGEHTGENPSLSVAAVALFDRAVADGWAADGADGFVYTTGFSGEPVVRTRMHWVLAEAINTAAALHARTGDGRYLDWYRRWWDYGERYLLDHERGSWHHELDAHNNPIAEVWPGKPDLYHTVQTTLIPRAPLATSVARAVADRHPSHA